MAITRTVDYYTSLPYTIEIVRQDEETWFARVVELPGCITEGNTLAEAVAMIQDAMSAWIEIALDDGRPIPEPRSLEDYSGKFVLRLPQSLHRDLAAAAAHEGVSLNQYLNVELARAVGRLAALDEETSSAGARRSVRQAPIAHQKGGTGLAPSAPAR